MKYLKRIVISGFRGILAPLTLDFTEGSRCRSVILYGANGTGKSSLTDAWEWITTGKIQHLAREGAEAGAYPHMGAKPGTTSVVAELSDPAIGSVKLQYDHSRVTKPKPTGNLPEFRALFTHPCHIRYGDLTRFVFLRKAERYDALAALMGFIPQMEYQKGLRRVQANLEREVTTLQTQKEDADSRLKELFGLLGVNVNQAVKQMATLCQAHGVQAAPTLEALEGAKLRLDTVVAQDPRAKKLADYANLEAALRACELSEGLGSQLESLRDGLGRVKAEQQQGLLATQLSIPLFEAAHDLLLKAKGTGKCPLCGQQFYGDLRQHVSSELAKMRHMKSLLENLKRCRETLSRRLAAQRPLSQTFNSALGQSRPDVNEALLRDFRNAAQGFDRCLNNVTQLLSFDSTCITDQLIKDLRAQEDSVAASTISFTQAGSKLATEVQSRKAALDKDPARLALVKDVSFLTSGLGLIHEIQKKTVRLKRAQLVLDGYRALVDDYVSACLSDVQMRFEEISDKVRAYFEHLERDTTGLGAPKLKLLPDQDRSVVLEVCFHGDAVDPAYKYLSESQLNSFGLAVFLASSTHFNKECPFLILDDVVNSFDSYKRPRLIELIKEHLEGRQILLMTHDRFWRDLLHRTLPNWRKIDFTSYAFGTGPTMSPGRTKLDAIEEALNRDEPEAAATILAPYMEDLLREILERFECEVIFNRRNEYTLDSLIDRFRVRASKKLGKDHPLTQAISELFDTNPYRNWTIHCKDPEAPIHKNEVQEVLRNWRQIERLVTCQDESCFEILRYEGTGSFRCPCGKTGLTKLN
ncbi:MAG: AAA family ATPase [Candidatus Coatesbacteria bacterium]|nr:AAA family ATPase [Candidatus Coatesbacteria bacterium]